MIIQNTFAAAAVACLALSPLVAQAAPAGSPVPTLRVILGNADAARANAGIYQWKRVNVEVDRIAAAEHTLESAGAADAALRTAVLSLRSARQAHDSDATAHAATTVSTLCASMLR
jgi:hypothetical protein